MEWLNGISQKSVSTCEKVVMNSGAVLQTETSGIEVDGDSVVAGEGTVALPGMRHGMS